MPAPGAPYNPKSDRRCAPGGPDAGWGDRRGPSAAAILPVAAPAGAPGHRRRDASDFADDSQTTMSQAQQIDRIGDEIDAFRVEFEKFFAGARQTPPDELRERIRVGLRRLRADPTPQLADNFRIGQLEARFNSFSEMFNRRVREREEGRMPARPVVHPAAEPDAARGVVVDGPVADAAARALYEGLTRDPESAERFDYPTFRRYLERQAEAIRAKTGCSGVRFRLATEGGRIKLKAKPIAG